MKHAKNYEEFAEWCEEISKNVKFEIKTGKNEVSSLKATIEKDAANKEKEADEDEKLH